MGDGADGNGRNRRRRCGGGASGEQTIGNGSGHSTAPLFRQLRARMKTIRNATNDLVLLLLPQCLLFLFFLLLVLPQGNRRDEGSLIRPAHPPPQRPPQSNIFNKACRDVR